MKNRRRQGRRALASKDTGEVNKIIVDQKKDLTSVMTGGKRKNRGDRIMAKPSERKKEKVKKVENRVTFRCNPQVWKDAGVILDGTGISRGKYCEMMLRSLVQSKQLSMKDLMGNIVGDLFEASILGTGKKEVKKK